MSLGRRFSRALRIVFLCLWLAIIIAGVGSYIADPAAFTPDKIAAFMQRFGGLVWAAYIAMSALRGFTLLPSTPLVLAGTLLFPGQRPLVFLISLVGIGVSSTMIYFFSEFLGFHEYFEKHRPEAVRRMRSKLEHPLGFLFVSAWAFFPLVPTDLVCYLAGSTRMNYWKFISAILVGEAILCSFYIFFGGTLVEYVR